MIQTLSAQGRALALAESCTAGLASDLLARTSGASRVLWGSFVCYTAAAKVSMLGLDQRLLDQYGPVSGETARGMALAALEKSGAYIAASVTGLAGPEGDGSPVPVGTVWIAVAVDGKAESEEFHFSGSRAEIRLQAAAAVLEKLRKKLDRA